MDLNFVSIKQDPYQRKSLYRAIQEAAFPVSTGAEQNKNAGCCTC